MFCILITNLFLGASNQNEPDVVKLVQIFTAQKYPFPFPNININLVDPAQLPYGPIKIHTCLKQAEVRNESWSYDDFKNYFYNILLVHFYGFGSL